METSPDAPSLPPLARRFFANRTLNLRSIKAIGFDMDYTLVHYDVDAWEQHAYEAARGFLRDDGWPVEALSFDRDFAQLGLVLDLQLGNLVKPNRFGYVTRAFHGTRSVDFEEQREAYSRTMVELKEPRWVFMSTLFSLSEATLFAQLVDLLDSGKLPDARVGYPQLYGVVRGALDKVHLEGGLKAQIARDPERFVVLDPELPLALADLRQAGKKLLLVTNSEWAYSSPIMSYAFDRYLAPGETWRDLFDLIVVGARKPDFFTGRAPFFELVDEDAGLLRPFVGEVGGGRVYLGGNAVALEGALDLSGDEILYVGDHIFSDVHASKDVLRWRTCLVIRELEDELAALEGFAQQQAELNELMAVKAAIEHRYSIARVKLQRLERHYGPRPEESESQLRSTILGCRAELVTLDERIAPLAREASQLMNRNWGLVLRAGNDKSLLARELERHADIYTSRVSNFLWQTPFDYSRAPRTWLPHDGRNDAHFRVK